MERPGCKHRDYNFDMSQGSAKCLGRRSSRKGQKIKKIEKKFYLASLGFYRAKISTGSAG
jgi:hypothetical protein